MKSKEQIAEELHNAYEEYSKKVGWNTQDKCKVKFKDLPKKNKEVMLYMATLVQNMILEEVRSIIKILNDKYDGAFDNKYGYNY